MRNTGVVKTGDMLLVDAGVEVDSLYTADITRTFPTNGKFTDFQKRLYQAVLDSQQAGFEAAKPGATYSDIHHACMRVIAERLHDWGLLPVSVEESLSPQGQQHRRWLACGVAHHLGLDVHDCAQARYESYQGAKITPGMIFTIEPGLYFREDDLLIPPEYRGIGHPHRGRRAHDRERPRMDFRRHPEADRRRRSLDGRAGCPSEVT